MSRTFSYFVILSNSRDLQPQKMESAARSLARIMKNDGVDAVLLVPV